MSEPSSAPPPPEPTDPSYGAPLPPPVAPPVKQPPRLAASWIGGVLAAGGVLAVVAGFLQYVKLTLPNGSYAFTGLGGESVTGPYEVSFFEPGNPGKTIFAVGVVAVVLGLLVVAQQGRLWTGIVAVVAGAIGTLLGIVALAEPSRDADTFRRQALLEGAANFEVSGSVGIGAILGLIGSLLALVAGILAIVIRRQRPSADVSTPPTEPGPEAELAS